MVQRAFASKTLLLVNTGDIEIFRSFSFVYYIVLVPVIKNIPPMWFVLNLLALKCLHNYFAIVIVVVTNHRATCENSMKP